jgi:hypothetical protein
MKLLALRCPLCAQPLAAEHDDVVVGCANCYAAVRIDEGGLAPVEVHYAAPRAGHASHWLPFWLFHGRIYLDSRQTQDSNKSAQKSAEKWWQEPRRFYVPAWDLPLHEAREIGGSLVEQQPVYQVAPRPAKTLFQAATVLPEDALKLLEFIILTIEARRADWLKELRFRVVVGEPTLWALPAQSKNKEWRFLA